MKKLFLIMVLSLFLTSTVFASPFLVCDVDPIVTSYLVTLDGGITEEVPAPLHYDLDGISNGNHNVVVQAKDLWGTSIAVPFDFAKELPSVSSGIAISID